MKHYAIDQWADFTRGLTGSEEFREMQAHIEGGCPGCRRLRDFSAKLAATCTGMASDVVPEPAVRLARAIFPIRAQEGPKHGNRLPVELIFDSFLVPSPVGLRATWQVGWQGLYRAGDCSVDVRIEPELKFPRAAVIGQITNHVQPERDMGNLPVCLRAGKMVVAETVSNRFGEFQLEYEQRSQLKLCIDLRDSNSIQVPLKRLISDQPATRSGTSSRQRSGKQRV